MWEKRYEQHYCYWPPLRRSESLHTDTTTIVNCILAIRRPHARVGRTDADFIRVSTFRKRAEFAATRFHKRMMVEVCGSLRTSSYVNKDGRKVYTSEIVVTNQEFAEHLAVE